MIRKIKVKLEKFVQKKKISKLTRKKKETEVITINVIHLEFYINPTISTLE